ncbi:MAG: nitroreductase family protein [Rikenellaceae bacterium]
MKAKVQIDIDSIGCIKCKACVDVCPAAIFVNGSSQIELQNINTCISCGHCVAICPKDVITHSRFGEGKVHTVEAGAKVDSDELLNLMRLRRSNRSMTSKPIPQQSLDKIIEAAFRAPTASNIQGLKFVLVQDRKVLDSIIDITLDYFRGLMNMVDKPIVRPLAMKINSDIAKYFKAFKRMLEQRAEGEDPVLRGATAMLIIYTDPKVRFGVQDSNLAYQNASLMAESLGVAQVYTGFVCMVADSDKKQKLQKLLGIEGTIHAGMALGMPSRTFSKYIDKKPIDLKII